MKMIKIEEMVILVLFIISLILALYVTHLGNKIYNLNNDIKSINNTQTLLTYELEGLFGNAYWKCSLWNMNNSIEMEVCNTIVYSNITHSYERFGNTFTARQQGRCLPEDCKYFILEKEGVRN